MPRLDKLFHVLVVLGAASCADDDTSPRDRLTDAAPTTSDGDAAQASDGAPATDDAGVSCFCETDACCDRSGETPVLQEGFVCCWSACA
jgi:hypothetical protein